MYHVVYSIEFTISPVENAFDFLSLYSEMKLLLE